MTAGVGRGNGVLVVWELLARGIGRSGGRGLSFFWFFEYECGGRGAGLK